jgi:hypothetical protein
MSPRNARRAAERQALKDNARKEISEAQMLANKANAQLSHGPATPEGLAISSRNHTIHGLTAQPSENFQVLADENQAAYDALLADFQREWKPVTTTEHDIILRLATHTWLRKRAGRLQDQILRNNGGYDMSPEDRKNFDLFARYYSFQGRACSKAFSEIIRLRNFQSKQAKDAAIVERRHLDIQIRFESQKRAAIAHAAKMETIRLKQEAIKQRNHHTPKPQTTPPPPETTQTQTA